MVNILSEGQAEYSVLYPQRSSTLNRDKFRVLNMSTLAERVQKLIDAGFPQADLARAAGVTKGTSNQWLNGGIKSIKLQYAQGIERLTGFNAEWLVTGEGEEKKGLGSREVNVDSVEHRASTVPLISWVQAGAWCEANDPYNVGDAEEWLSCPVRHGPRTYALRVRGESMRNPGAKPSFEDGDIIFVDPDRIASNRSLVITKLVGSNEVTFKRLLIDGTSWYLEALNPAWPNRILPIESEAHVCGVVIARLESFV